MTTQALTTRPYQVDAQMALWKAFSESGLNRLLMKMPTGTGKSHTLADFFARSHVQEFAKSRRAGARILWIAHREELLEQGAEAIRLANPGLMVAVEQGERHAPAGSDVIVASIQTLASTGFRRIDRIIRRGVPPIVVVDEAHHAAARTYRVVLAKLGFLPLGNQQEAQSDDIEAANWDDVAVMKQALDGWDATAPKDRLLIGATATPNRSDAIGLGCVFQSLTYSYALKQAIDDGWLVKITPWSIETAENLDAVKMTAGDFNQKQLAEAVNKDRRNRLGLAAWTQYAGDRPTLGFTVDVAHAHACADLWQGAGYRFQALSGETPKDDRRIMLRQLSEGQLQGIFNCMVLTEGTDLPIVSCILHLKPTKSATLFEQMSGRGLRLYPGKSDCVLIDLVDVSKRHSLQTAPVLYGLPPGLKAEGEDLQKLSDELEQLREKFPGLDAMLESGHYTLDEIRDRASTFDIWTVPQLGAIGEGLSLRWIRMGDVYRVQYPWSFGEEEGTETLQVSADMLDHWDVSCTFKAKPTDGNHHAPRPVRQRTLAKEVTDAREALRLAEEFVQHERRAVAKMKDVDAPWRSRPASRKQKEYLSKLAQRFPEIRAALNPKLTSGNASDLIDLARARMGK